MSVLPMLCVADLPATAALLSDLFGWRSTHGGAAFDELVDTDGTRVLWLHLLQAHEHARFRDNDQGGLGRGLALYVFVDDIYLVEQRVRKAGLSIVEALALNPAANFQEFTCQLPDGYHITVAERPTWTGAPAT